MNSRILDLEGRHLTTEDIINKIIPFLKRHPGLTKVNLNRNEIGDEGAIALATVDTLTHLYLNSNLISDEGTKALANTKFKTLHLSGNFIDNNGVGALAKSGFTKVDLSYNNIVDNINYWGFINNTTITSLNLSGNEVMPDCLEHLILDNQTLQTLILCSMNNYTYKFLFITTKITEALANNKITTLHLSNNNIEDDDVIILYKSGNKTLKNLDLSNNNITDKGAKYLAYMLTLKKLSLRNCQIRYDGVMNLMIHSNLGFLDLSFNKLTDKEMKAVRIYNNTVEEINLSNNDISDAGAKEISRTNLKVVDLSSNKITEKSFKYLFSYNKNTLMHVELGDNDITYKKAHKFSFYNTGFTIYYNSINRHNKNQISIGPDKKIEHLKITRNQLSSL